MASNGSTSSARRHEPLAVLDDGVRVAAILPPLRRRILGHLHAEPDSATGLARKLALPRQKVNYHLRELERTGFLELAHSTRRRGCIERTLRPTARAYLINPALLGELSVDPEMLRDRFSSSYLMAVAGRVVRDVSILRGRAARARKRLPTFTLQTDIHFRTPGERASFAEELTAVVARLAAKYHTGSSGSRAYRFVIGGHPNISDQAGATAASRKGEGKEVSTGKVSGRRRMKR